jgi:hypothetical protein
MGLFPAQLKTNTTDIQDQILTYADLFQDRILTYADLFHLNRSGMGQTGQTECSLMVIYCMVVDCITLEHGPKGWRRHVSLL